MRHRKLPPETTRRVLNYLDYAWASNKGIDEREVLSGLPQSLQEEVQVSAHWQMIAQVMPSPHWRDESCSRRIQTIPRPVVASAAIGYVIVTPGLLILYAPPQRTYQTHQVPLFEGCSERLLARIIKQLKTREYLPGDRVIKAGDKGRDMVGRSRRGHTLDAPPAFLWLPTAVNTMQHTAAHS